MTAVSIILLGVGIVLIASAMDNTPIIQTLQKIMSGQTIDWTGTQVAQATAGGVTPPVAPTPTPLAGTPTPTPLIG
jgi:hypothetical protein